MRAERVRKAEERSREAARQARQRQEEAARERIRKQREAEAELRSQQAIRRRQAEQAREAAERLKLILIEEKQVVLRSNWARLRDKAERQQPGLSTNETSTPSPAAVSSCVHPQVRWPRKKGRARCSFCDTCREKWSFQCPVCHAGACPLCITQYCFV
jgi:hypothetical protein